MTRRSRLATLGMLTLLPLLAVGCAGEPEAVTATMDDSVDVDLVLSPGEDRSIDWALERDFSLGGEGEGPEAFYDMSPRHVATDSLGRIYVLDAPNYRVVIFSPDGTFIREVGREGEGPGELSFPASLAVSPGGEVSVFDYGKGGTAGKRAIVPYAADGTILDRTPLSLPPPNSRRHIAGFGSGMLALGTAPGSSDDVTRNVLRLIQGRDTVEVADASFARTQMVIYEACGGGLNFPRLFEAGIEWAPAGDSVVVSRRPTYELEVYEGTDLVRRFGRDLPPRDATRALAIQELGEGMTFTFQSVACTIPPDEMVDGRGFAPLIPWIRKVALAPSGEAWVRRWGVGPKAEEPIDVFDETGEYVGSLPSGSPFPLVFLGNDRFGAAETDELDITRLVVYRVLRDNPPG